MHIEYDLKNMKEYGVLFRILRQMIPVYTFSHSSLTFILSVPSIYIHSSIQSLLFLSGTEEILACKLENWNEYCIQQNVL
jgi:hypothetical protein